MEGPKLETLPSNCMRHIFSLLTFEEVSQLREVCTAFNRVGKMVLCKGRRDLKDRLQREMETAKEMVLFPYHSRISFDTYHFLNDMYEAINSCTLTYLYFLDVHQYYFVAGKVLDEANALLKGQHGSTTTRLPYYKEDVDNHKPHPLLKPLMDLTFNASYHFIIEILLKFLHFNHEGPLEDYRPVRFYKQLRAEFKAGNNEWKTKKEKMIMLIKGEQRISSGKQLRRNLLNIVLNLNQKVLLLTEKATEMDEKLELKLDENIMEESTTSKPKKVLEIPVKNGVNLGTLPSCCIQRIVHHLSYERVSQLRRVCRSFDAVCKNKLKEGYEILMLELEKEVRWMELYTSSFHLCDDVQMSTCLNYYKDLTACLLTCGYHYLWYMGDSYYFIAGKVLDEVKCLYQSLGVRDQPHLYFAFKYHWRPHCDLLDLTEMVNKTIAHFNIRVIPKYFRSSQNKQYLPDVIASGSSMKFGRKKEKRLQLERLNKLLEEQEVKIERQNKNNKKSLKVIACLHKTLEKLTYEVTEKTEKSIEKYS